MTVVRKASDLQRQVDAAGIGDVDTGETALLGDGLGPHVPLQRDRKVTPRRNPVFIGEDHAVLPLDDADAGHNAAAGNMPALFLLIGRPAVEPLLADVVSGVQPQFEKIRFGINQHPDQFAHRLLALLRKTLRLGRAADIVGLLAMTKQKRVLLLPVLPIRLALLLLALRPRQTYFRLFRHIPYSLYIDSIKSP